MDPVVIKTTAITANCVAPICRACLRTHCRLYSIRRLNFEQFFTEVIGIPRDQNDKYPQGICVECANLLTKYKKFLDETRSAHRILAKILRTDGLITSQAVQEFVQSSGTLSVKNYKPDHYDLHINVLMVNSESSSKTHTKPRTLDKQVLESKINYGHDIADIEVLDKKEGVNQPINQLLSKWAVEATLIDWKDVIIEEDVRKVGESYVKMQVLKKHVHESNKKDAIVQKSNEIHDEKSNENKDESGSYSKIKADMVEYVETIGHEPAVEESTEQFDQDIDQSVLDVDSNTDKFKYIKRSIKFGNSVYSKYFTRKTLSFHEQREDMQKLRRHQKFHKIPFKCELCCKGFLNHNTYKLHMLHHSEDSGPFVCYICNYRYMTKTKLEVHILNSHEQLYSCKQCNFQCKHSAAAYAHIREHQGKMYECKICNTKYRWRSSYVGHRRDFHPSGRHVCALCAKTFLKESGLQNHMRQHVALQHRPIPEDGPVCDVCNVKFLSKEVLIKHIGISHNEEAFIVGPDNKGRRRRPRRKALKRQPKVRPRKRRRKASQPPPPCSECGKQFDSGSALFTHLRRFHPNSDAFAKKLAQWTYLCDLCGRTFAFLCSLRDHRAMHTLGRLQCDECDRSYNSKTGLKDHKKTAHAGVAYACSVCQMTFSSEGNRRRHEKYAHRTKSHEECEFCGRAFKSPATKYKHQYVYRTTSRGRCANET